MNDYWNDPPEYEEVPECCDQVMDVDDNGNCSCSKCGKLIKAPEDPKPEDYL
jgi:hypothetical protein